MLCVTLYYYHKYGNNITYFRIYPECISGYFDVKSKDLELYKGFLGMYSYWRQPHDIVSLRCLNAMDSMFHTLSVSQITIFGRVRSINKNKGV